MRTNIFADFSPGSLVHVRSLPAALMAYKSHGGLASLSSSVASSTLDVDVQVGRSEGPGDVVDHLGNIHCVDHTCHSLVVEACSYTAG